MNSENILRATYIDILFEGKNKQYGGYTLRKNYSKHALLAVGLLLLSLCLILGISKLKANDDSAILPPIVNKELPVTTINKILEEETPRFVLPASAPVKSRFKLEPPVIAKNDAVQESEVLAKIPTDDTKVAGPNNSIGSDRPEDIDPGIVQRGGRSDGIIHSKNDSIDDETIYVKVDQKAVPSYDLQDFVRKNLIYPASAAQVEIEGIVLISFIVEKDGKITNVKLANKDIGGGCSDAAISVVKKFPKWEPAKQNGKNVRSFFRYPISFQLNR